MLQLNKWKLLACMLYAIMLNTTKVIAQAESAPKGGNAMAASREGAVPVNYYTGIPSISLPLYSFSNKNGLALNLSLDYFAGGVKVNDLPSTAGLGWNVNVGGVVTRTIRGLADDHFENGYLYNNALTDDQRLKVRENYNSCIDAEQDVYQFNMNGMSGRFYIGRDKKIITSVSGIRISVQMDPRPEFLLVDDQVTGITGFTITTDNGVKYVFDNIEYQTSKTYRCSGAGTSLVPYNLTYGSAWYLSKIIAPYSTDTIAISYKSASIFDVGISPQVHTISSTSVNAHSDTTSSYTFTTTISSRIPTKIRFPDSTFVDFLYSYKTTLSNYYAYPILERIKVSDTALLYGYMFKWDTTTVNFKDRVFLQGINYYTKSRLMPGYSFTYNTPRLPILESDTSKTTTKHDHFGYYNGLNGNKNIVPTVAGIYTGADRTVNSNALASSLASVTDPSGGTTHYKFENNEVLPVTNSLQTLSIDATTTTSNSVTLSRAHSIGYSFQVTISNICGRIATSAPLTGSQNMVFSITNTSGTVTYFTTNVNLAEIYYNGSQTINCSLQNGSYLIKTSLASGVTASASLPVTITWFNQPATGASAVLAGGIRIKQITHYDPLYNKTDTIATYRYVMPDGKSSGIGGQVPVYNYTTYKIDYVSSLLTATLPMQNIISNPSNFYSFAEPSFVGYKRVEIIKGSLTHNLGKQVYEMTGADEGYSNTDPFIFPYLPRVSQDWAAGLPKRIQVYDSLGRMIKLTTNTYDLIPKVAAGDTNFRSLKLEIISNNSGGALGLERVKHYVGRWYFPQEGTINLVATTDTFYHPDLSISTSRQQMEYDNRQNIKKITTDYDKTRGLSLEKRFYYSYDYNVAGGNGQLKSDSVFIPIAHESWITGDGNPRMIGGEIASYSSFDLISGNGKARLTSRYVFESNKPIAESVIGTFNPSSLVRNSTWFVPTDSITWNKSGIMKLQMLDKKTNYSSVVIMGHSERWPLAKVSNALFADVAYSSFETADNGNWTIPAYTASINNYLTGKRSYPLSSGNISKSGLQSSTNYYLTFWLKSGSSASTTAGTPVLTDSQNGWNFYTLIFTGSTSVTISGTGYIDELRLHPRDANMVSMTYNGLGAVTSSADASNTIIYNFYDSSNRLLLVRDKDMNIIKKYEYPANVLTINQDPVWTVVPSSFICEIDPVNFHNTGWRLQQQRDENIYSETYKSSRYIRYDINYGTCPVPPVDCGTDPRYKSINGVCEQGCRMNTSSVYKRVIDPVTGYIVLKWTCTYHFLWSDNSISPDFFEEGSSPCTVSAFCEL